MKRTFLSIFAVLFFAALMQAQIVITEISYNPPEAGTDSLEYIELHNKSAMQVDVSNWSFSKGFVYKFAAGTVLNPGEYVVISKTEITFNSIFGFKPLVWEAPGALTNGGETITLVNAAGAFIDSVAYTNITPWPLSANGMGGSLVLCDVNADNNVGSNWIASTKATGKIVNGIEVKGSPGAAETCAPVVPPTYPVRTIAQMTTENTSGVADSVNASCTLTGTVNITNLRAAGLQFSIQDNSAGVTVFRQTGNFGYTPKVGDKVLVKGIMQQFNGLNQVVADTVLFQSANAPLTAVTVTALNEDTESEFVKINRTLRLVDAAQWTTGVGASGFSAAAVDVNSPLDTISIRIDNDITALYNAPAPVGSFTLSGVCTQFDASSPFTSGYQILPRAINDIGSVATFEPLDVQVVVAPNPVSDLLRLSSSDLVDRVIVTDLLGREVARVENPMQQTEIVSAAWPNALYAVTLWKDAKSKTILVVKQ
jgi:Lamin Tail Domain